MKRNRFSRFLSLLFVIGSLTFCISNDNYYVQAKDESIVPTYNAKRKYVEVVYGTAMNAPDYIFYVCPQSGYKGYLGRITDISHENMTYAKYAGYIYPGPPYPMPANVMNIDNEVRSLESKFVKVYKHYSHDSEIKDIWYSSGGYSGWLYERDAEAYQNADFSWDVYYKGYVYKGPFVPNALEPDLKR